MTTIHYKQLDWTWTARAEGYLITVKQERHPKVGGIATGGPGAARYWWSVQRIRTLRHVDHGSAQSWSGGQLAATNAANRDRRERERAAKAA